MENFEEDSPVTIHDRAIENLAFIRDTMERSTPFTGISGKGMVLMGIVALAGGFVARMDPARDWWVYVWFGVACMGASLGLATMAIKMRGLDRPSVVRAARRFAFNMAPAILVGVFLTEVFYELGLDAFLPGMWLLLYGTGVVAGGALSVRLLPTLGALFMLLGGITLFWTLWGSASFAIPDAVGEMAMALGFGGLHITAGLIIHFRYGG